MFKIDDDPRVTRVGRWLRRRRFDELPQLINVLRARCASSGRGPLIPEEHRCVDDWATKRLDLRPGMTGLWQVLGSDSIEFERDGRARLPLCHLLVARPRIALILRTAPFLLVPGTRDS